MPESGGAITLNPGTNFENSSVCAPYLEKAAFVLFTQLSGRHDSRHMRLSTAPPWTRPIWYQMRSASSDAPRAVSRQPGKSSSPEEMSAPAARSAGKAGIGTPICSKNTQMNMPPYPQSHHGCGDEPILLQ
jgi:hypothetical protein